MRRVLQRVLIPLLLLAGGILPARSAATSKGMPSLPSDLPSLEARLAADPTNVPVLVRAALEYHNQAAFGSGNPSAPLQRSKACLETVLHLEPGNAFARALLGSAIIISAREALWPGTKIRRVREGLTLMDAAVREDPADADARFTRASNNLFLPDLFHRKDVIRGDFAWLQERAERNEFTEDFRQYVFLYHGFAHKRWGDVPRARQLWEAGLKVNPESAVATELRHELSGHSDLSRIPSN